MAIKPLDALRRFFETGDTARKIEMKELKDLSADERRELAELAAKELGEELTPRPGAN